MIYNYYRNERKVIVMWKVYRYAEKDVVSEYGDIIYPAGKYTYITALAKMATQILSSKF